MREYRIAFNTLFAAILIFYFAANIASAQYWFQTGVRGSDNASFNSGASVLIQTVKPQNISYGSFGYWIGENLNNGAFLQVGYIINNQSGYYPTNCTVSLGCTGNIYIQKGQPSWFWEYFPANYNGNKFYGMLGGNDTAGANGSFNDYSFIADGNTWNIYMNEVPIGSVNLGTSSSGANPPTAFSEYADGENNSVFMPTVRFRNLMFYKGGKFYLVPEGYAYTGYGKGSETSLSNNYGVNEIGNFVDYFETGSDVPSVPSLTPLWQIGYSIKVVSDYGNISRYSNYSAYATTGISAPEYVNISNGVREKFAGWKGIGDGSYTGYSRSASISMDSNITETASWTRQYYVNATTPYGSVNGSGWYDDGANAIVSLSKSYIQENSTFRTAFSEWSNGNSSAAFNFTVNRSIDLEAEFVLERQVGLMWEDAYGNPINVSYFYINGHKYAGDYAYLYINNSNIVSGAMYKGAYLSYNKSVEITYNTASAAIKLPVFNAAILTRSFFGTPVDANLSLSFYNGTTYNTTSGSSGTFTMHDIPYGEVYGSAKFFGTTQSINISGGQNVYLDFFTPSLIAVIILGVILIIAAGIFGKARNFQKK